MAEIDIGRRLRLTALTRAFIDYGSHRKAVLLAGSGRSGTTWIAQLISSRGGWRLMFEPFHSRQIDLLSDWNYRQYLRPGDRDDRFVEPAARILTGKLRHPWVDRFNPSLLAARKRNPRQRAIAVASQRVPGGTDRAFAASSLRCGFIEAVAWLGRANST